MLLYVQSERYPSETPPNNSQLSRLTMTKSMTLLQDMSHRSMVNTMVMIVVLFSRVSTQCNHGDVRLVNGSVPNEGRVEVCVSSIWGTVCDMGWNIGDAKVVCRQVGYTPDEPIVKPGSYYGPGKGPIWLDNVRCNLERDMTLLECLRRPTVRHQCDHTRDAGVQCRDDQDGVKIITTTIINPIHTVMISWSLGNSTQADEPTMFKIECFSEKHSTAISVSNQTSTVNLGGLLSSTSYTCCVSVIYELYTARRVCTEIETTTTAITEANSNNVVGGVLGFIITVLLILLVLAGILLIYLLRPHWKERLSRTLARLPESRSVNQHNTIQDMSVRSNLSYVTTSSRSTKTTPQAVSRSGADATTVNQDEAQYSDYSCLGPNYEAIDTRSDSQRKNQGQARLVSERYEYSEAHLAIDGSAKERSANYEIPLNLRQNECVKDEDYSHLKY